MNINDGSFSTRLVMLPENEKWDSLNIMQNKTEFNYSVPHLFNIKELEQISLCCGNYSLKDSVTARHKKFILKVKQ